VYHIEIPGFFIEDLAKNCTSSVILLFLIFREVVCWYWKINERLRVLEETRDLVRLMNNKLGQSEALTQDTQGHHIIPES